MTATMANQGKLNLVIDIAVSFAEKIFLLR